MNFSKLTRWTLLAGALAVLSGCASQVKQMDYSAFKASHPKSILVLPPVNNSPDVNATFSMLSQTTYPLAEAGYYVMPVTLVTETFYQNGLSNPPEMHAVAPTKLREIFGADAGLYITISRYGSTYAVFDSAAVVTASAELVDLRTGTSLWRGTATASNNEGGNSNSGGLVGMLVTAVVKQIVNSVTDASHPVAGVTSMRLLSAGQPNGLLYGPRSPHYGRDGQAR
ncbi:MAG: hypothetical protein RLZ81_2910 [Pseudomonadota bacterium]|jgi:hypothetical protein|uniref:DUF799 domain-containing protein n=1 Tax=Aquabacterium sp. TaxID=1872578 RepID=UPI001B46F109|nr:DUF799 domain-containing protein [Aquabacterium sp.]MBP7132901.1 DUF799 domain-containing protein [Aquabacterium sp.]MBP9062197.1 DUF799 domain-containing protein [Aquabacterium sp.]MDQ5926006.1 hypothetical protein [Pseudomonadota bacterium]